MKSVYLVLFVLLSMGSWAHGEGAIQITDTPRAEIVWRGQGRGMYTCGTGSGFFYGTSGKPNTLDVLQWAGKQVEKVHEVLVEGSYGPVVPLHNERYLVHMQDPELSLRKAKTREVIRSWPYERGWYIEDIQSNGNGSFVVVAIVEDSGIRPADFDFNRRRLQLGLLDVKREQLNWFVTIRQTERDGMLISKAVVSEDGRLIAIPGWYSGLAVVSVPEKRLLWETRGRDIGGIADAGFSPDGKTVYCGGSDGCVYQMDSATGLILTKWWANHEDRSVYGQRITGMAASGDGRLVAAGTGPQGLVYVATAAGQKTKVFSHGVTVYTLSFSPDSKSLATVAGGKIKIWELAHK